MRARQLFAVDKDEAIANLELGMTNILNTFHSLYDACNENTAIKVEWYSIPELLVVLSVRNAKHHNHANKIRSFFSAKAKEIVAKIEKKTLLVDFPKDDCQLGCIDFYISWSDFDAYLSLPRKNVKEKKLEEAKLLVREYLNADAFESYATASKLDFNDIYINLVPLVMNAGIFLYPSIKDFLTLTSSEAESFNDYFRDECSFVTQKHTYQILNF